MSSKSLIRYTWQEPKENSYIEILCDWVMKVLRLRATENRLKLP